MLSYRNTYREVRDSGVELAIQPVGSNEQHSLHLPYCTDVEIISAVASDVAKRLNAFLLPCLPYSSSIEHRGFIGSVWLKPNTLRLVIQDIVESLYTHGIFNVVLMNGHGGNFILKPTVRELNCNLAKLKLIMVDFGFMTSGSEGPEVHSGDFETSIMLHIKPELVKKGSIDYVPDTPREFLDYVGLKQLSENGVWGVPSKASKLNGEKYYNELVEKAVSYIKRAYEILGSK